MTLKKNKLFCSLLIIFNSLNANCQGSFEILISTPKDERIFDAAEGENGLYYLVGRKFSIDPWEESSLFLAINNLGEIVHNWEYSLNDSLSYFGSIHYMNDSIFIFGAKGTYTNGLQNILWMLVMDTEFNTILNKSYDLSGYNLLDIETIINDNGNFVVTGVVSYPSELPDMLFYEISSSGDSINRSVLSYDSGQFEHDLIEVVSEGYKVFAYGSFPDAPQTIGKIVTVDRSFNFISADSIPYSLYFNHSAKRLNDSSYLVTGNKGIIYNDTVRTDIGIIKMTLSDEMLNGNHFGKYGDTISYVGACSNLDFISQENIFFGGASNIFPSHLMYQPEDSWLLLNNIDSDLNTIWQRFYGGDACYYLWGLKATQDGGCLLLATRYEEIIQDHELDIYILKVDPSGLLTSTGEGPKIPVQQLAIVPNPAWDIVSVRYPDIFGFDEKEIEIFNSQGWLVHEVHATQNLSETRVDVSYLPAGLYFVVLKVEGKKVATGKMVKI